MNSDRPLNPFEPSRIDPLDLRTLEWENQDVSVRTCQVIVAALSMGVLTFAGVAFFKSGFQIKFFATATTLLGVVLALVAIMMSFAIPALISGLGGSRLSSPREPTSEVVKKLFAVFQTQLILGCAFLEGAAFLNVFLYQISNSIFSLVAFAICLALLLVRIPTKGKIQGWIARRLSVSR